MAGVQQAEAEPSMEEILASIRKIIADEDIKPAEAPDNKLETPFEEGEVLELTQLVEEDGSVVDLTKTPEQEVTVTDQLLEELAPAMAAALAAEVQTAVETPISSPVIAAKQSSATQESLISEQTVNSSTNSLSALANVLQVERLAASAPSWTPMGNGARTLEDMVMELMKPMLQSWLDENLPAVVDRLVQKEIDRISRRTNT